MPARTLRPRGHAIESRITSEDPFNDFLPATGRIEYLRVPTGPGVRWDGGIEVGSNVGLFYDPLLAKLVVWAEDRPAAIRRMQRALADLAIVGVPTSQPFHARVMREPNFQGGVYSIRYLDDHGDALLSQTPDPADLEQAAVAAALAEHERLERLVAVDGDHRCETNWVRAARLRGLR
jgi:acetyl-CoA carboxylase biotin carboxylase subunit